MDTKKLRQKILDLAIHGKLVPQDPNDEPASVLLERIRAEKERLIAEGKIKKPKAKKTSDTPHYENDAPFDVPEGWVWTTLKELCCFLSRGKSPKYSETDNTYPVFAQKCNLFNGDISLEKARFLDPDTLPKWGEDYKLQDDDVLVNSTGTGTVGRTRLFHSDCLGNYPFTVPDSHVSVIRTFDSIDSKFVLAYLSSDLTQGYLEDNLAGSTNQKELYIGVLENLAFPLPPLAEQRLISSEIDRWYGQINEIESDGNDLQGILGNIKSKVLDLAIHGKLVSQDPNDEPASELLKRINPKAEIASDNRHYENIPKGWAVTQLDSICSLSEGQSLTGKVLPYLDVKGLRSNQYSSKTSGKFIEQGTMLILVDGENSGEVFQAPIEGYQGSTMKVLIISPLINRDYILYFIKFYQKALRENKVGSAIPHLNKKMFRELEIAIPPINEQKRIVAAIDLLMDKLNEIAITLI